MGTAIVNSCICSGTCIHAPSSLPHTQTHTACGLSLSLAEHSGVLKGQLSRPSGLHISRGCCVDIIISGLVAAKAKVICNLPNYLLQDDKTNERCVILPKSINISSCFFFLHTSSLVRLFLMQMGKLSLKCVLEASHSTIAWD